MRAREVQNFKQGGDPYRKMRIGRHSKSSTIKKIKHAVDDIFWLWDEYFDDRQSISWAMMNQGAQILIDIKTFNTLSIKDQNIMQKKIDEILEGLDTEIVDDVFKIDIIINIYN